MADHCFSRRNFLGIGLGGVLSALTGIDALAQEPSGKRSARAKRVLVIFEQGGISQMDTWDPKPEAPVEHRSPFKPVKTSASGVYFTELLAKTGMVANKLTV